MKREMMVVVVGLFISFLMVVSGCSGDTTYHTENFNSLGEPVVLVNGEVHTTVGGTLALTATTVNDTDSSYTWGSNDILVGSVAADGTFTAVSTGTVVITATGDSSGVSGSHRIYVDAAGGGGLPVVTVSGAVYAVVGDTLSLSAATVNGMDSSYSWASDNELTGTIDASGTFAAVSAGTVTITATGADTAATGTHEIYVAASSDPLIVPKRTDWESSTHADTASPAFNVWNADSPAEIPTSCARCHSTAGFRDYLGDDGSSVEVVDAAAAVGSVIECVACHNDTTATLDTVLFPSGKRLDDLGNEAICMTCHQGRESTVSVEAMIAAASPVDDDTVSASLNARDIHYLPSGASLNGGAVQGGYQYAGKVYDVRFRHAGQIETCSECHDAHSTAVDPTFCAGCHSGVTTAADLPDIRMESSLATDYDGDGNLAEGIAAEVDGLHALLLQAIQAYATEVAGRDLCYAAGVTPSFFIDGDGDGSCSVAEAALSNSYDAWTARLVRAAYNYQFVERDPAAYVHNAKYLIQLQYDAIADLNLALGTPVDLTFANREDPGHFNGANEPARHWDADLTISSSCSRCHGGAEGLQFYLQYGVGSEVPQGNGLECETCHSSLGDAVVPWTARTTDTVLFPSRIVFNDPGSSDNICMTCHAGRESKTTIDAVISAGAPRFRNVHYMPAAAVYLGADVQVGYEYDGNIYSGAWTGHLGGDGCIACHDPLATEHTFRIAANPSCGAAGICHAAAGGYVNIRGAGRTDDYDGDGNATETLDGEIQGLAAGVMTAMQDHAALGGSAICYDGVRYPYFLQDTNGNGICDAGEFSGFNNWDAALVKAAHNYQISQKERGAWAHNFNYMAQLLYDSIGDLGGSTTGMTRPAP